MIDFSTMLAVVSSYCTPPIQIGILIVIVFAIRRFILHRRTIDLSEEEKEEELPALDKRDFTLEELKEYNGVDNPHVLIAVNGKVFDVTRGKNFYGPDGPYSIFAGRDASRGLATFSIDQSAIRDTYDDLSDMNTLQMESVIEWELQFVEKYDEVGKLLKPGEKATNYKLDESEDEFKSSHILGGDANKKDD